MSLMKTVQHGQTLRVGDAEITVEWARRGQARLRITAPPTVVIETLHPEETTRAHRDR